MKKLLSAAIALIFIFSVGSAKRDMLALPDVPKDLTVPIDRANYILNHFWDDLDFSDTKRSRNEKLMEQAFSDFISVFPHASEEARKEAVANLLKRAEADNKAYTILRRLSETYLYYTDSPFMNEDYYLIFLDNFNGSPLLEQFDALRVNAQLQELKKNLPGSTAPDFDFTLRNGENSTLYTYPAQGDIMLIFYDPDCDHCEKVIKKLKNDKKLNEEIALGETSVLAIYSGSNKKLWDKTAPALPENWAVGYEPGTLEDEDLYIIRLYPSIYLLDSNRTVLTKNLKVE